MIDSLSSVEYALFAALARQERLHSLDARGRGAQLPVPLELVDVLAEDVAGAEGADEVVELAGLVAAAAAARHAPVTVHAGKICIVEKVAVQTMLQVERTQKEVRMGWGQL